MLRVLLGIIKGGVVGAALGFGATKVGLADGVLSWALYGAVGFAVGLVCGKAIWRQETLWTPVLKGIFGVLVSLGLAWVGKKALGGVVLPFNAAVGAPAGASVAAVPAFLAPLIGIVYGIFVEIDDGGSDDAKTKTGNAGSAPAAK